MADALHIRASRCTPTCVIAIYKNLEVADYKLSYFPFNTTKHFHHTVSIIHYSNIVAPVSRKLTFTRSP